jgi:hypothetical protein
MDIDTIENILDTFERAVDRKVCAEIDAGACRTEWDYKQRDLAEEAYHEARDRAVSDLLALTRR